MRLSNVQGLCGFVQEQTCCDAPATQCLMRHRQSHPTPSSRPRSYYNGYNISWNFGVSVPAQGRINFKVVNLGLDQ